MDADSVALVTLIILAVTCFMAGVHMDRSFYWVSAALALAAVIGTEVEAYLWMLAAIAIVAIAITVFAATALRRRATSPRAQEDKARSMLAKIRRNRRGGNSDGHSHPRHRLGHQFPGRAAGCARQSVRQGIRIVAADSFARRSPRDFPRHGFKGRSRSRSSSPLCTSSARLRPPSRDDACSAHLTT